MSDVENSKFLELVRRRRSCRSYKADSVEPEKLSMLLEAARLAPSACNKQPWRFAVVTNREKRLDLIEKSFLPGIRMKWAVNAPIIIVLGMEKSLVTHKVAPRISGVQYPLIDLGIAGEHLVLQAEELGLGTCWIGWIRPKIVRKIVGWPQSIEPASLMTVGYPAGESVEKARKNLDDIVTMLD